MRSQTPRSHAVKRRHEVMLAHSDTREIMADSERFMEYVQRTLYEELDYSLDANDIQDAIPEMIDLSLQLDTVMPIALVLALIDLSPADQIPPSLVDLPVTSLIDFAIPFTDPHGCEVLELFSLALQHNCEVDLQVVVFTAAACDACGFEDIHPEKLYALTVMLQRVPGPQFTPIWMDLATSITEEILNRAAAVDEYIPVLSELIESVSTKLHGLPTFTIDQWYDIVVHFTEICDWIFIKFQ